MPAALDAWRRACAPIRILPWPGSTWAATCSSGARAKTPPPRCSAPARWRRRLLPAHILAGDALVHLGRFDEAARRYRHALARHPVLRRCLARAGQHQDPAARRRGHRRSCRPRLERLDVADTDRIAMGFALGKALEDRARYREAFAALAAANARMRKLSPWRADLFGQHVTRMLDASREAAARPPTRRWDSEVIFIVGLPRSGSTLFEQILAAHPAGGRSQRTGRPGRGDRRGIAPPAAAVSRLGERCQRRTTGNDWSALPGAHRALAQRTPAAHRQAAGELALHRRAGAPCCRARRWSMRDATRWKRAGPASSSSSTGCRTSPATWPTSPPTPATTSGRWRPGRRRSRSASAPSATRRCSTIPKARSAPCWRSAACPSTRPASITTSAMRSVRTPSAAQVRQPLRRDTARAAHYGALLDPLRQRPGPAAGVMSPPPRSTFLHGDDCVRSSARR